MTISSAKIQFNELGTPVATDFDDVYFSNANGLEETHYVFLQNNGIPQRWQTWPQREFVIAETGFGTGLNFLATLVVFEQFLSTNTNTSLHTLYYISTEKFPLSEQDLIAALANWPQLAKYSEELIAQYPPAVSGCHRMTFLQGKVVLDLWLGDVHESLPQWSNRREGIVDAWYLDGFAPSKNPQMWTPALFEQMARLSHGTCTFATFTAAGLVKRGLREVGFTVEKRKGFGHKRDMLAGYFVEKEPTKQTQRYYYRHKGHNLNTSSKVAVIGAGLAGANITLALARRGIEVEVFCKDPEPAQGASGNHQGGFYPQLNADPGINSQVQATSFIYARNLYDQILSCGFDFPHQWCGVLQVSFNDKVTERHKNLLAKKAWPTELVHAMDAKEAENMAKVKLSYPGLFMPLGGWINPPSLVCQMFAYAKTMAGHNLHFNKTLVDVNYQNQQWQLGFQDGSKATYDLVILACGAESQQFEQLSLFPLRQVRGQVELIPSKAPYDQLATVLCHKGYMTPAMNGTHALGSTYVKNDASLEYREQERQTNLQTHLKALDKSPWVETIANSDTGEGRASIRCSSPDHLPLVGSVADINRQQIDYQDLYKALPLNNYPYPADPDNLFMLTGLGSRGLTTAPLMAEMLASQICGQPLPMAEKLLNSLNPNRFAIRNLIRRT